MQACIGVNFCHTLGMVPGFERERPHTSYKTRLRSLAMRRAEQQHSAGADLRDLL